MLLPELGTPLRTLPLTGVSSRCILQSHQPYAWLSDLQDCRYVQCSKSYQHTAECKPRNSFAVASRSLTSATLQKRPLTCPEPFDEAQGERNSDILDPLTTELPAPKLREPPFGLIGNYTLPQAFTPSGLMTIIGRCSIAIERYWRYFLRRRFTALRCFWPVSSILARPDTRT
jgi:hypothetical protein